MGFDAGDFDIIEFLEDRDIFYRTSGKNVTDGWIETNCPFCGSDPSEHFGINIQSGFGNCWICGESAHPVKLVKELDNCSWLEAELAVTEFSQGIIRPQPEKKEHIPAPKIIWPKHTQDKIPSLHRKYLEGRNYDLDYLTRKYRLKFTTTLGDWKFRVIIPVIFKGKIVSYTSRDVTTKASLAYKHLPDPKSIIPIKQTLYNFDTVNRTAILVEGIMDVWRIGDGAIASYGTQLSKTQILLLTSIDNLIIMFDSDATDKAYKLAKKMANIVDNVEVISLSDGDPGELTEEDVKELRDEVF